MTTLVSVCSWTIDSTQNPYVVVRIRISYVNPYLVRETQIYVSELNFMTESVNGLLIGTWMNKLEILGLKGVNLSQV